MDSFFLISTETRLLIPPRQCTSLRRLSNGVMNDLMLVTVDPPIPRDAYGTKGALTELLLGPKYDRGALFAKEPDMPIYVYVFKAPESVTNDGLVKERLSVLDWGAIYDDYRQAEAAILPDWR